MDKKVVRKRKIDFKLLSVVVLVACIVAGLISVCLGAGKIHGYFNQLGTKSVEELSVDIEELAKEYDVIEAQKLEEIEKNGYSDKYIELNEKAAELSAKISADTNSRYMRETGYNNPQNFYEMLRLAPELWIGATVIAVGFVAFFVLRNLKLEKK